MSEDTLKRCTGCSEWKPLEEFPVRGNRPCGRQSKCKACHREYQRLRKQANPENARAIRRKAQQRYRETHPDCDREQYERAREKVFDHYGRVCVCCGATENLSIDHPAGDGSVHRTELFGSRNASGQPFYLWLIREGFPEGYQVLCLPCNKSKSNGPACKLHVVTS